MGRYQACQQLAMSKMQALICGRDMVASFLNVAFWAEQRGGSQAVRFLRSDNEQCQRFEALKV